MSQAIFERRLKAYLNTGWETVSKTEKEITLSYENNENITFRLCVEYTKEKPEYTWISEERPYTSHILIFEFKNILFYLEAKIIEDRIVFYLHCLNENFSFYSARKYIIKRKYKRFLKEVLLWFKDKLINLPSYRLPFVTGVLQIQYTDEVQAINR